jgi:hypothetical protein
LAGRVALLRPAEAEFEFEFEFESGMFAAKRVAGVPRATWLA